MKTAVINIKIEAQIKTRAQKVASELGFSLSSLINGYLRSLVKTKTIHFSLRDEEPSELLIKAIKEAEEDRNAGRISPSFDNAKDAIAWLDNSKRKYKNES
jgi:addiction module RelB/DinJ family antitoxin